MFHLAKRSPKYGGTANCDCLKSRYKDDTSKLSLVVPEDMTRDNDQHGRWGDSDWPLGKTPPSAPER